MMVLPIRTDSSCKNATGSSACKLYKQSDNDMLGEESNQVWAISCLISSDRRLSGMSFDVNALLNGENNGDSEKITAWVEKIAGDKWQVFWKNYNGLLNGYCLSCRSYSKSSSSLKDKYVSLSCRLRGPHPPSIHPPTPRTWHSFPLIPHTGMGTKLTL